MPGSAGVFCCLAHRGRESLRRSWVLFIIGILLAGCNSGQVSGGGAAPLEIRIGYQANLTHAQALLGVADGRFERAAGVKITPRVFHSGPASIAALMAGEVDLLYVGPSPAVTAFVRSQGQALQIIAGAASGGAVLVLRPGFTVDNLAQARLATPGLANTQDISLRHLLLTQGAKTREQGGKVRLSPMSGADILMLFRRDQIDGAWVSEPWGARLTHEAGAEIAIDERELWPDGRFATTVLAVSGRFLAQHRDIAVQILRAHIDLTAWMQAHPKEAVEGLQRELTRLQGKPLGDAIMADAYSRIGFLIDPMQESVFEQANRMVSLGYLGERRPDLQRLYDLSLLKEAER
jgi:NitT/TauT family transport system substrate-binding protein